jgi:putative DNA primase/helicase
MISSQQPPINSRGDPAETADRLRRAGLIEPGRVVELRALHVRNGRGRPLDYNGFFEADRLEELLRAAFRLEKTATGVYYTLNSLKPDVLAVRGHRVDVAGTGECAQDTDVLRRTHLLVDADVRRRKGISATDAEKTRAYDVILAVREFLLGRGFPPMVLADSGNGYHLLPRVDLPNDDDARELARRFLQALAARFDTPDVHIDVTVFNAARITKLYGTLVRKGDHTAERPHRCCGLLDVPADPRVTPREAVESVAAEAPTGGKPSNGHAPPRPSANGDAREAAADPADVELLNRARAAKNGADFRRLHDEGDITGYKSSSEAVFDLLKMYSFWAEKDPARVDRLFRASKLFPLRADKWDRLGAQEVAKAIAATKKAYGRGRQAGSDVASGGAPVVERNNDPHRLARLVLGDYATADGNRLRYWQEQFHAWEGGAYRPVEPAEMRALVTAAVKAEFDRLNRRALAAWRAAGAATKAPTALPVTHGLVGNVLQALAGYRVLPGALAPPAWLDGPGPHPAAEYVACRNGLLHLPTLAESRRNPLLPPTPRFFTPNALGIDYRADAPPPREWLAYLRQLWPDDLESQEALQEWFGYLLTADTRQQKILMLVGPRRSGKGTIARVLRGLVGAGNVAGPTLSSLSGNFGLQPLLGKSVAVISDARLSGRADAAAVTERLLAISGEDAVTVDRKHLSPVTTRLHSRFVILTNELPKLSDASGALVGRLVILRLVRSWYGEEDTRLTDRLLAELPGILAWAVAGWHRLQERRRFVQPRSGAELAGDLEDLSSPVGAFVRECCEVGAGHEVPVQDLYQQWRRWCESKGAKVSTEQTFGRDLRAAIPALEVRQPRAAGGRLRCYAGLRVRPDVEAGAIPD